MRKYNEEKLREAIRCSKSIAQVLRKLGIVPAGGNYITVKERIQKYGIDTSHFTGQLWNKGKKLPKKRAIEEYLSNKFYIGSSKLRLRLIDERILEYRCVSCKNTEWLGSPIPLELHHINGNSRDNNLDNLELRCPNCHANTSSYRRRK